MVGILGYCFLNFWCTVPVLVGYFVQVAVCRCSFAVASLTLHFHDASAVLVYSFPSAVRVRVCLP
ncbi:hypothetical protein BDV36DRAFT_247880 [Aspergillus pseudocaelatus]|uniref:Secreted protein n=1 Tax=Aspergillus pseudocaelatus TaxID=1825620 RepID=A0ABQ6WWE9_9EURO|nr:hypothetical protein BDV36DRAFT_247880 [Aspergillus pseudocaelatus]